VTPRKGHDVLVAALAGLGDLPWRLTIAGSLARAPEQVARLRAAIERTGLAGRVELLGEIDDAALAALYASADVFVMPSLYEGYGMALAEALACGLPIATTTGGAAAETVPDDAALKVPPADAAALGAALRRLVVDPTLRSTLAQAAWRAGQELPSWDDAARIVAGVLREMAEGRPA
jgi:glycosyltransferase involved in cell wall biosynthesis